LFTTAHFLVTSEPARSADGSHKDSTTGRILSRGAAVHGTNGIIFDRHDRLYVASFWGREILIMDPRNGKILQRIGFPELDVGEPDDLIFGADGSLYWTSLVSGHVYRLSPDGTTSSLLVGPGVNPITFSDDGRLFVSQCFLGDVLYEIDPALEQPPRVIRSDLGPGCGLNGMDWFGGYLYGPRWFTGEVVRVDVDSGEVTTVANGFGIPSAVKFDSKGRLHVLDSRSGEIVRVNLANGQRAVIAALSPGLDNLAFDSHDRLFVSNLADGSILEVLPNGHGRTVSKGGLIGPGGVAVVADRSGRDRVFVADVFSLREYNSRTGRLQNITIGLFEPAEVSFPLTVSADGNQLIVSSWGINSVQVFDPDSGTVLEQHFDFALPLNAIRYRGDLVVAELLTGRVVQRNTNTGERVTLASGLSVPTGLAGTDTDLWVADWLTGIVWQVVANGVPQPTPIEVASGLDRPEGLAVARDGSLLVVESGSGRLSRIDLTTGQVGPIATGLAVQSSGPPRVPGTWVFNGVAVGQSGVIYVTGDLDNVLYRFEPHVADPRR
jgi:sugar lactone lactonase YvrE